MTQIEIKYFFYSHLAQCFWDKLTHVACHATGKNTINANHAQHKIWIELIRMARQMFHQPYTYIFGVIASSLSRWHIDYVRT